MILVELYSKEDCHLCDQAKQLLLKVQKAYPFELQQILIREGDQHFEKFKERIPVVFINKEFAFQFRMTETELRKKLSMAEQSP